MAAAITTSTLGLFMDSWRTFDAVDEDKEEIDGWKGGTGLTTITMEYDFRKFGDGFLEDSCDSEFEDDVEEPGVDVECEDKNTLVMTLDISESCEDAEKQLKEIEDDGDIDSEYLQEQRDEVDGICQTDSAGTTGSILLWVGFGTAILSTVLCIISAFVSNSGLRLSSGLIGTFSGLFMCASAILWLTLLPVEDIDINEGVWDLGVNFFLTLVGGFLAIVAGIIALNAKKRGGKKYNYNMSQEDFQQQQQFYQEQTQYYQQPDPYQQW